MKEEKRKVKPIKIKNFENKKLDERLIIGEESENDEEIEEIEESFEDEDNEEEDSLDDNHFREKVRENWRKYSYIDIKKLLKNTNIAQETTHIYCKVALILQAKDYNPFTYYDKKKLEFFYIIKYYF